MVRALTEAVRITEQNWGDDTRPVVSVFNWSFNHVDFIRPSIESILEQKTTFPVEIIIHDDASTDGTQEIIREYETRYPRLFRNIIHSENQWNQGKSVMAPLIKAPRGKYIALSHGDDCWADPLKLQKQVDYLEAHAECVLSYHDASVIDSDGRMLSKSKLRPEQKTDYTQDQLILNGACLTLTMCFRNIIRCYPDELVSCFNGDKILIVLLGQNGTGHYHSDIIPALYRKHPGGVFSMQTEAYKLEQNAYTRRQLARYFKRTGKSRFEIQFAEQLLGNLWQLYFLFKREGQRRKARGLFIPILTASLMHFGLKRFLLECYRFFRMQIYFLKPRDQGDK